MKPDTRDTRTHAYNENTTQRALSILTKSVHVDILRVPALHCMSKLRFNTDFSTRHTDVYAGYLIFFRNIISLVQYYENNISTLNVEYFEGLRT